ncbi:sulfotransferase family protein [Rhodopirellula bahusiensis]|uniref:sulfotransferase family protein n=1 Tax=Rhodopirellula bahusiensis TaxID=2014065 RepID=UPI003267F6F5
MDPNRRYLFSAGLPRSGSTLLSAIIDQNPLIHSGPASPVWSLTTAAAKLLQSPVSIANLKPAIERRLVSSVIETYYSDRAEPVVIDQSRDWLAHVDLISEFITPAPKIICTVRHPLEILASFVEAIEKSPTVSLIDHAIIGSGQHPTIANRYETHMSPGGPIYISLNALASAFSDGYRDCVHLIDYDQLVEDPAEEVDRLYQFLELEPYQHDFENIVNRHKTRDVEAFGIEGLHYIRKSIGKRQRDYRASLPDDVLARYENWDLWNFETVVGSYDSKRNSLVSDCS